MSQSARTRCLWDLQPIDGPVFPGHLSPDASYGWRPFCSPECCVAHDAATNFGHRISQIWSQARRFGLKTADMHGAALPRQSLTCFGGAVPLAEFRRSEWPRLAGEYSAGGGRLPELRPMRVRPYSAENSESAE